MKFTARFACLLMMVLSVEGHGRLVDPPSRSTMWRYGYKTPHNYNDMELFCGGFSRQWGRNEGKCGICGDPYDGARPNEAGGKYATGAVVRTYAQGSQFSSTVQLTANHKGYFVFKICPAPSDPNVEVTQECLDMNTLPLADDSGIEYHVPHSGSGMFNIDLRLPAHLTCERCVFQWTYVAGNNWGACDDGTEKVGCGAQEQFRGCADVTIIDNGNGITQYTNSDREEVTPSHHHHHHVTSASAEPPSVTSESPASTTPRRRRPRPRPPTRRPFRTTTTNSTPPKGHVFKLAAGSTTVSPPGATLWHSDGSAGSATEITPQCFAAGRWSNVPGIAKWCMDNCFHNPPYCPESHCRCTTTTAR